MAPWRCEAISRRLQGRFSEGAAMGEVEGTPGQGLRTAGPRWGQTPGWGTRSWAQRGRSVWAHFPSFWEWVSLNAVGGCTLASPLQIFLLCPLVCKARALGSPQFCDLKMCWGSSGAAKNWPTLRSIKWKRMFLLYSTQVLIYSWGGWPLSMLPSDTASPEELKAFDLPATPIFHSQWLTYSYQINVTSSIFHPRKERKERKDWFWKKWRMSQKERKKSQSINNTGRGVEKHFSPLASSATWDLLRWWGERLPCFPTWEHFSLSSSNLWMWRKSFLTLWYSYLHLESQALWGAKQE